MNKSVKAICAIIFINCYSQLIYRTMKSERIESLAQILEEHGVVANDEQLEKIVDDFSLHIEMEAEMASYGHVDRSGKCDKCEQLQKQLDSERGDSEAYRKFIMKDKQASWVGVENGTVKGTYR